MTSTAYCGSIGRYWAVSRRSVFSSRFAGDSSTLQNVPRAVVVGTRSAVAGLVSAPGCSATENVEVSWPPGPTDSVAGAGRAGGGGVAVVETRYIGRPYITTSCSTFSSYGVTRATSAE